MGIGRETHLPHSPHFSQAFLQRFVDQACRYGTENSRWRLNPCRGRCCPVPSRKSDADRVSAAVRQVKWVDENVANKCWSFLPNQFHF